MDKREYWRKYYAGNREKLIKKNVQWQKEHPEKKREYARKYRETHREQTRERERALYAKQKAIRNGTYFEWPEERPPVGQAPVGCVYPDCFNCQLGDCIREDA